MNTCIFCLEEDHDVAQCMSRFGCECRYCAHADCDDTYHARIDAKCVYCRQEAIHPAHGEFAMGGGLPLGGEIFPNENALDELPDLVALEDQINNFMANNNDWENNQINFIFEQFGVVLGGNPVNVNFLEVEENPVWGGGFPLDNNNINRLNDILIENV